MVDLDLDGTPLGSVTTGTAGGFRTRVEVPRSTLPGPYAITATGETSGLVADGRFLVRTDWTTFQFSNDRVGANPYENVLSPDTVAGLGLRWSGSLGAESRATPVVSGGIVYTDSYDGSVQAWDETTGRQLWTASMTGSTSPSEPAVADGRVFVGDIHGSVYASMPRRARRTGRRTSSASCSALPWWPTVASTCPETAVPRCTR